MTKRNAIIARLSSRELEMELLRRAIAGWPASVAQADVEAIQRKHLRASDELVRQARLHAAARKDAA